MSDFFVGWNFYILSFVGIRFYLETNSENAK